MWLHHSCLFGCYSPPSKSLSHSSCVFLRHIRKYLCTSEYLVAVHAHTMAHIYTATFVLNYLQSLGLYLGWLETTFQLPMKW